MPSRMRRAPRRHGCGFRPSNRKLAPRFRWCRRASPERKRHGPPAGTSAGSIGTRHAGDPWPRRRSPSCWRPSWSPAPASPAKGVSGPVSYGVVSHATGSLTFDAARLRASAGQAGVRVSPMPSTIDGSTLVVNGGPALIEVWGLGTTRETMGIPTLVIAQTRVPTVDSSGANVSQLEDYLLSQPGVPPELAAQIKAIKDPSTTLPIPIPKGLATTESTQVNGTPAVLIKAALGAGVVWVKNGVIYAVGGQLTPDQV